MGSNNRPSTYWHLYDYYLYPAGGYFGAKKANEPLHVQYSYDDRSIVVVNNKLERFAALTVNADVYDSNFKRIFSQEAKLDAEADSSTRVLSIPSLSSIAPSPVYFVKLSLKNSAGEEVSSNFYWLPVKLSMINWEKASLDTDHAPIATYEDLTALNHLPRVRLQAKAQVGALQAGDEVRVTLHNPTQNLAFQVHLGIRNPGSEDEVLPVLWEDNYIVLLPNESTVLTARYLTKHALEPGATLVVEGWNVDPVNVSVEADALASSASQLKAK